MALTQVSRGLMSTSIDDNVNATAITIDSSDNVTFSGTVTASEMTVLVGGLRSLGVSATGDGIWNQTAVLNNSWFNTLLDMGVKWSETGINSYEATDQSSGKVTRTASRCDLVFGSNSQLRAIVEVYAQNDNSDKFISDFVSSWVKVMNADRFE